MMNNNVEKMENDKLFLYVKKIFYGEIISECASKSLKIKDFSPTLYFKTSIDGSYKLNEEDKAEPVLVIDNKDEFDKALYEYAKEAIKFYGNNHITHNNLKFVMSLVFANASPYDLANPVSYLKHRLALIKNDLSETMYSKFLDYHMKVEIKKQDVILEAPFAFKATIFDEEDEYELPQILFSSNLDTAYVYAIQNKFKNNNKLSKKIKRILYKFNSNFDDNEKDEVLNATDVTMSFIASIVLFIKYLNSKEIDKIVLKTNMPVRYNSHYESYNRRLKHYKEIYTDSEYKAIKDMYKEKNSLYNDNIFMKIVRTFYRISKQGNVIDLDYSFFNFNSDINILLNKEGNFNNDLYNQIYEEEIIKK